MESDKENTQGENEVDTYPVGSAEVLQDGLWSQNASLSDSLNLKNLFWKFEVVESSGHKLDPEDVASEMRRVRNAEGKRIFRIDEFLSGNRVSSYFCRLD